MLRIDAHQHFWTFDPVRDSWITAEMGAIQKDFLPDDLKPLLQANGFDGSVVVQSDQSEKENAYQLAHAASHDFIKGVVGWVDLQASDVEDKLAHYSQFQKMKGFRHVLQGESDRALMLTPAFKRGIEKLRQFGFTYDILIYPDQLPYVMELIRSFTKHSFVIDHMAKPHIKDKKIKEWARDIRGIAEFENVYCKISGMVTEADWHKWRQRDFIPYLDVIVEAFGPKRIMFGSDWPVCLMAATYSEMLQIVQTYFSGFSTDEQALIFGGNATIFYNLRSD